MVDCSDRTARLDCIVLASVILISALPYVFHLGFYGDDWAYQAALAHSSGKGIVAMVREVINWDPTINVRPVQTAYLVLSFKAFGRHPTPYHLFDAALLSFITVMLYLTLRELEVDRWVAFGLAVIFGLLPHYSTDRLWIAAHQATLSLAFALFGIYALLRSHRSAARRPAIWLVFAVASLVLSFLSYEVQAGLIIVVLSVIGVRRYLLGSRSETFSVVTQAGIAATMMLLLVVGILKARLQTRMIFPRLVPRHFIEHSGHVLAQAFQFLFWTYGLHMPAVVISLYRHSALSLSAVSVSILVTSAVAAYYWRSMDPSGIPSRRACLGLTVLGFALFGLGCALFFPDSAFNFSSAGIQNRTTIASALGAACILMAGAGLASSLIRSPAARVRTYSLAVGLICGANCMVVNGIGFYWARAASLQSAILLEVADNVPSLPSESVLLLDGFCRYTGPGIIFEDDWDTSGAVQLALHDNFLRSDVISPNLQFTASGADTTMYGQPEAHYNYSDHLFVFNVRNGAFVKLPSRVAADAYLLVMNPSRDSGCPVGREGEGETVF